MELFEPLERILCMRPQRVGQFERAIYLVRGRRVMLDSDLALIYGVTTARLNQQVNRNQGRFPEDFIFRLAKPEFDALMLQIATSKVGRGGRRKAPYVFTEHGAIMLASVLNTPVAMKASVQVVRAFVQLREMLAARGGWARKFADFEKRLTEQGGQIKTLFEAIQELGNPPEEPRRKIGFEL